MSGTSKTVSVNLPDEPYKTTTAKGLKFTITYNGPKYILVQVDKDDHQCRESGRSEVAGSREIDPSFFDQDEFSYVVLDAYANDDACRIAAYLTDEYTHPDVDDYKEVCTDADGNTWTWEHVYEGTTGMMAHIHWAESVLYNPVTQVWTQPQLRTHVNTRKSVLDSMTDQAAVIDAALAYEENKDLTDADRSTLTNYSAWIKLIAADVRYKDINHWKIPFPEEPLPFFELPPL